MPYLFEFNSTNRIIRCRYDGPMNDENLRGYYEDAPRYVAAHAPCSGIFDMVAVTSFDFLPI